MYVELTECINIIISIVCNYLSILNNDYCFQELAFLMKACKRLRYKTYYKAQPILPVLDHQESHFKIEKRLGVVPIRYRLTFT